MVRMLIYVPRMYDREEFRRLTGIAPQDFDQKEKEFWEYVEEKLTLLGRIQRIYLEGLVSGGKEGLKTLNPENRNHVIIRKLVENGAVLHSTEDPIMVAESESWLDMMMKQPSSEIYDFYKESIKERDNYIANIINQTLKEDEIGVLFIESTHRVELPDVKIIKMCRFEPSDYLNIWLQKLKIKKA